MSLVHCVLTIYKGLRVMDTFGLTPSIIAKGIDHIDPPIKTNENRGIVDMLNVNTAYCLTDLVLLCSKDPKSQMPYIFHHSAVIAATTATKVGIQRQFLFQMKTTLHELAVIE